MHFKQIHWGCNRVYNVTGFQHSKKELRQPYYKVQMQIPQDNIIRITVK